MNQERPLGRIQNGIRCPRCEEEIYSNSRHDLVTCKCGACFIDGGFDYKRVGWSEEVGRPIDISRVIDVPLRPYFRRTASRT